MSQTIYHWQSSPNHQYAGSGGSTYSSQQQQQNMMSSDQQRYGLSKRPAAGAPGTPNNMILKGDRDNRMAQSNRLSSRPTQPISFSSSGGGMFGSLLTKLLFTLACVGAGMYAGLWYDQQYKIPSIEFKQETKLHQAKSIERQLREKMYDLEARQTETMQRERELNRTTHVIEQHRNELWGLMSKMKDEKEKFQKAVQKESHRLLIQKYGPGPHRLEIQLGFHPDSNVYEEGRNDQHSVIVIELAPEHLMPHTVWMFLEQVSNGLWDGTSFHRSAHHILQAGPVGNFYTPARAGNLANRFHQASLSQVLFSEYHPSFPHAQYTLGLVGRPGGPDFYINTQDNTHAHGPQPAGDNEKDKILTELGLANVAQPCFAKVIDGFDAIQRLQRAEVQMGGFKRLKHFIAIQHVRMLPTQ